MEQIVSHTSLRCRVCGSAEAVVPRSYCEQCFGPLEAVYDYALLKEQLTRDLIEQRPRGIFRYRELLPLDREPQFGHEVGDTPLIRAPRLGKALGIDDLWLKNDAVNAPTLSFKDRVVAVALAKAVEFGFDTVGCASTGNLANSVAAQAARGGLRAFILIPAGLERAKIIASLVFGPEVVEVEGNYDDVNRLCSEIADQYSIGFVNVNLRPYYAEGSKTLGYEVARDLGWRAPDNVVCPMAGGSLIGKIEKAFAELAEIGLIAERPTKMFGAQARGCQPIVEAYERGDHEIRPVRPDTVAKSLAIGNPADGYFASKLITESGGAAAGVTDAELIDGMRLLAATEGVFAETAGGVAVAAAKKLAQRGAFAKGSTTVIAITGNGLKTIDAIDGVVAAPHRIEKRLAAFRPIFERSAA
jgi:threonine synthase